MEKLKNITELKRNALILLSDLISKPSFSREEKQTGDIIYHFFENLGIGCHRVKNNIWAYNKNFDASKPTLLLNSHHDTIKPNTGYTKDPFSPVTADGKIFGLGSNDAGGALVSLISTFLYFFDDRDLKYNLCIACTGEEEISGSDGIELFLSASMECCHLGSHPEDCAIIGEPTLMQMAIAEKGLLVLDCFAKGIAGHAARNEGVNALYIAAEDICHLKEFKFEKVSSFLGPVKLTVSCISTENKAHNVVPDVCHFIMDIRVNELYTFDEIQQLLKINMKSDFKARSKRLKSSIIPVDHPLVQSGMNAGKTMYGSPTTSDKALVGIPALKMGPGDSARSHTADEFIYIKEIEEGIDEYINIVGNLIKKSLYKEHEQSVHKLK